jgi:hypothetical protein
MKQLVLDHTEDSFTAGGRGRHIHIRRTEVGEKAGDVTVFV